MNIDSAEQVSSICWQFREADWIRGQDRGLVNRLFNGHPPYTPTEADENNIEVNVNFLEATSLGHDARQQFNQAYMKPGNFFTCTTDGGAVHKRQKRSQIRTKEINRVLKKDLKYFETKRSKFAGLILHGIGPSVWQKRATESWRPRAIGVEDLMIPAQTRLDFENLPFFCILRSFTAPELCRIRNSTKIDKGWNIPLINQLIRWIDTQTLALLGSNFPELYSPEKAEERLKGDGGWYAGDAVPTVDVFDFWYWSDKGKHEGWRRRMVVDDWNAPISTAASWTRKDDLRFTRNNWIYNGGDRVFADSHEQIFSCQFGDLSAVAPFHYHTVRGLGLLVYAVCHLQNRLRCRFTEAVFENLMMYFRVKNAEDIQRALKVNLVNRGFIDPTIDFIDPSQRWQINEALAQLGLNENAQLISRHSSSYTGSQVQPSSDKVEKTKFQFMAETSATAQMVSVALMQAYHYDNLEYREINRRFCQERSRDPDVKTVNARCRRQDIPDSLLYNPEAWEIEPERVMGGGNKALEMAIAQQLLAMRNLYDPEPQRQILRDVTLAITDDAARAEMLVPDVPEISNSIHDAQLRFGSLMAGGEVKPKSGVNHIEVIEVLLRDMEGAVQRTKATGGVPERALDLIGLINVGSHIAEEIQLLAQDPNEKQRVKQYGDRLAKLMNEVRAFGQRFVEQRQKQNGQGQIDPEMMAQIQAMMMQAKAKADNTRESHAQRTAQRQIAFELEEQRKQREFEREMRNDASLQAQDLAAGNLKAGQELAASRLQESEE